MTDIDKLSIVAEAKVPQSWIDEITDKLPSAIELRSEAGIMVNIPHVLFSGVFTPKAPDDNGVHKLCREARSKATHWLIMWRSDETT